MIVVRLERRNRQGHVLTVMEKEFEYMYNTVLVRWLRDELRQGIYAGDIVTITNITPEV